MDKQTDRFSPVNGGVNSKTGDMVLLFGSKDGREIRVEIPFDQSLAMFEMVKRAATQAAEHPRNELPKSSERWDCNLRAYEAKEILFGNEIGSERNILTLRTVDNFQITAVVDKKISEEVGLARLSQSTVAGVTGPYASVAEDIDHLQRTWCTIFTPPSDTELRWGVAALRRLLVNGLLGRAWRAMGFEGEPVIASPDIEAMLQRQGTEVRHIASLIAGGGSVDGVEVCGLGMARVRNLETGRGPDEEEGFAVSVFNFSRDARSELTAGEYDEIVRSPTRLSAFLRSCSAIRRGQAVNRQEMIQYFAKWAGGVHLDAERQSAEDPPHPFNLIRELEGKVRALSMDGLDFELLSIGQLLGRSLDLELLKRKIVERSADQPVTT